MQLQVVLQLILVSALCASATPTMYCGAASTPQMDFWSPFSGRLHPSCKVAYQSLSYPPQVTYSCKPYSWYGLTGPAVNSGCTLYPDFLELSYEQSTRSDYKFKCTQKARDAVRPVPVVVSTGTTAGPVDPPDWSPFSGRVHPGCRATGRTLSMTPKTQYTCKPYGMFGLSSPAVNSGCTLVSNLYRLPSEQRAASTYSFTCPEEIRLQE